jgi:hypothetical protein
MPKKIVTNKLNPTTDAVPYGWDCVEAGEQGTSLEREISPNLWRKWEAYERAYERSRMRVRIIANSILTVSAAFMFMFGWELALAGPSVFTLFPLVASLTMWQLSRTIRDETFATQRDTSNG